MQNVRLLCLTVITLPARDAFDPTQNYVSLPK